jgi:hypothetical protein
MSKKTMLLAVAITAAAGAAHAQECLHGQGETAEQAARRRDALTAARAVNTIQASQPGARDKRFLAHAELAKAGMPRQFADRFAGPQLSFDPAQEILPGWKLTLDRTDNGYWFIVKDVTDPCGFAWISNQAGLIFKAEPLR